MTDPHRVVARDDPMDKVLGLDAGTSGVGAWLGFGSGGTLLAAGAMALAAFVAWLHTTKAHVADTTQDVDLIAEAPPPPPPPPPPEPEPERQPEPAPRAFHDAPPSAPQAPPAQAAKVLAQEPDPKDPVDLTGNVFVQGSGEAYVGGPTSGTGTGKDADRAGYGPPAANRGAGPLLAAPPPRVAADLSRTASIGNWSCSDFPAEADTAGVDDAYVMIQVDVSAAGSPTAVRVLQDPGNGFGTQARRCAMRQHFQPALDHEGNPMPGTTNAFRVHFSR